MYTLIAPTTAVLPSYRFGILRPARSTVNTSGPSQTRAVRPGAPKRRLAAAACFDCHSNETEWPWYTSVAPFSWLTQHDVEEGRAALNFSEWDRPQETDEVTEAIREGSMPPWYYRLLHPAAPCPTPSWND